MDVSQKYKIKFPQTLLIKRLRTNVVVNMNEYLSALSFFKLLVRKPIISIRRKRPVIIRRSSFYIRTLREVVSVNKPIKQQIINLMLRRTRSKKLNRVFRNVSIKNVDFISRRLFCKFRRKLKKKLIFNNYKKSSNKSLSLIYPTNISAFLNSNLSYLKTYNIWKKVIRLLENLNVFSILELIDRSNYVKSAKLLKKFSFMSAFSRIVGKKIRRARLYEKRSTALNRKFFL